MYIDVKQDHAKVLISKPSVLPLLSTGIGFSEFNGFNDALEFSRRFEFRASSSLMRCSVSQLNDRVSVSISDGLMISLNCIKLFISAEYTIARRNEPTYR